MRCGALAIMMMIWPPALSAQPLPALYDVRDVAADDVLNIRAEASASSSIIGTFPPDQQNVEIIELSGSGKWGRVNTHEFSGWASMRYLRPIGNPVWSSGQMPLYCFGAEPFWSLQVTPVNNDTLFEPLGETPQAPPITQFLQSTDGYPPEILLRFDQPGVTGATFTSQICSDGMSDRLFGIEARVLSTSDDALVPPSMVFGCCSLSP
jgi:hypothetical protein